jgi:hypothetical protein
MAASSPWVGSSTPDSPPSVSAFLLSLFRLALAASLALSALLYIPFTWHWPLVGDASLIHYIAFLIERGWAPYRDLGDMNMPGAFLIELAAMHLFGPGTLAWRLFDFTLLAAATAAFFSLFKHPGALPMTTPPSWMGSKNRLAALFASSLFILIHGRDGLAQGGQRDLTIAVCLLAATAFLLKTLRHPRAPWSSAAFGLLSGIAFTIKPTTALLPAAQLLLVLYARRRPGAFDTPEDKSQTLVTGQFTPSIAFAALAYLIAPAICLVFLLREHALPAFLAGLHSIVPYYASLGHRPLSYILVHSLSPILSVVLLWLAVLVLDPPKLLRPTLDLTRALLLLGVLFGLANCIVQARALPYYRYPLLAFLLPLLALDLTAALTHAYSPLNFRQRAASILAIAALVVGGLFLAPQSAVLIHRYRWWQTDFITSLERDLTALGGPALSRHIQCIDSVSGCNTVLYDLRLEPATGVLSDFLLFGAVTDSQPSASIHIVATTRRQFSASLLAHPPQVIVVTSHLHIDGPDHYAKLDRWPALATFLDAHYTLATEWSTTTTNRWWSREELPAGYRIYLLRDHPLKARTTP